MTVFADTSALLPFLDSDDADHEATMTAFASLRGKENLLTHNYVVVECSALVHRRLGPPVTRAFFQRVLPLLQVVYVDEDVHRAATAAFLAALKRRASLVDWVSFEVMRRMGIETALALDQDFRDEGFQTIPVGR